MHACVEDERQGAAMATRAQDERRRAQMRANGPIERFSMREIGDRDNWLCGICQDAAQPVDPARKRPDPLSPSIDHIMPIALGGAHARTNVQISHWFCNQEKNIGGRSGRSPEFMRARLALRLDGTPIPEALWRAQSSGRSPRLPRHEYMLALYIELGDVAAEPGSEPAMSRLQRLARVRGIAEEAIQDELARMRTRRAKRTSH